MPGLRITEMEARFGDAPGLRAISLAVARGERLAVVGTSGAGKTTLLRAVAGLAPVRAGRVEIGGRDVTRLPPERRGAAYLHQTPVLFPHLSVFENVAFALRLRRRGAAEVARRVERLLAAVGLPGLAGRSPAALSGGQRHRIALARAMAAEPDVLLLDEPLSALDPSLRQEVRDAILALQAEHAPALVLVTHDLDEAALTADRVAVLLGGEIAQVASPADLFARPATLAVARFLGIPNEIRGRVAADGCFESHLGRIFVPAATAGAREALALFRADAVRLIAAAGGPGTVVGIRHRAQATTARVRVGPCEIEGRVSEPLEPGTRVEVRVDGDRLVLFDADPPP